MARRARLIVISALVFVPTTGPRAFGSPTSGVVFAGTTSSEPTITVGLETKGAEQQPGFAYRIRVRCIDGSAAEVDRAAGFTGEFPLAAGQTKEIGRREFPKLAFADSCTVRATDTSGAPVSYLTTIRSRSDGSTPDPRPGLISTDGYVSTPASADGQRVIVTVSYTGDLAIAQRIEGLPQGATAQFETTVACRDSGYFNTVSLGDGQVQILTGIPAGSTCELSQARPGTAARFEDNSGNPGDATVVITGTQADCWDLRNASPDCRATAVVSNSFEIDFAEPAEPSDEAPTTTVPDDEQGQPATTAAPAVEPAPAIAVEAAPNFTG